MSTLKKILYSLAAGLTAVLISLYTAGGQPAEYRAFLQTTQPGEKIFPYLTDPAKVRLWIGALVESKPLTDGPIRAGSRSQEIVACPPIFIGGPERNPRTAARGCFRRHRWRSVTQPPRGSRWRGCAVQSRSNPRSQAPA